MTGTTPTPPAKQPPNLDLYSVVAQRRTGNDGMVWQAPILSLTAQAFLLTIALSSDSEPTARYISAGLALIAALASMQLMAKHRTFERWDSEWLKRYEEAHYNDEKTSGGLVYGKVHARNDQKPMKDLLNYHSFCPNWPQRMRNTL